MHLSLILALQAAAAAPVDGHAPPRWALPDRIARDPPVFDLASHNASPGAGGCGSRGEADVLVCGARRTGGAYPMAYWASVFGAERPIRAEVDLGGNVQGRVHAEAVAMDRGAVSNRVMIGIRWPF